MMRKLILLCLALALAAASGELARGRWSHHVMDVRSRCHRRCACVLFEPVAEDC